MTLSEVALKTGMNRAKARRFLLTFHSLGYMRKEGRQFALAPKTLRLGHAFLSANNYRAVIQQHLADITQATGESSSMGMLDADEVVYIARSAAPHRLMGITLSIGTRLPAVATSMGRTLLAHLPDGELDALLQRTPLKGYTQRTIIDPVKLRQHLAEVRAQGFALVDQELEDGLRSLAVPSFDANGKLLGAINISTNAARIDLETLTGEFLPLLQDKARLIASQVY